MFFSSVKKVLIAYRNLILSAKLSEIKMSDRRIYFFIELILFNILFNSKIIDSYIIFLRSLSFWNSKISKIL
ncbi:hypothetical protein NUSPORA_02586 [Nucleospora cyclopteri]